MKQAPLRFRYRLVRRDLVPKPPDQRELERDRFEFEKTKASVDQKRLDLEAEKAKLERRLLNKHLGTVITAIVSLAAVLVTVGERDFREFLARYLPAKPGEMRTPDGRDRRSRGAVPAGTSAGRSRPS